ncbi:MAG: helix-turn-helix transcriptional regulator [Methylibium sp.]
MNNNVPTDLTTDGDLHPVRTRSGTKRPIVHPPLPETNTDVALINLTDFVALTRMSRSWILQEVAAGRAPLPVIRRPRCTRWKLSDARLFAVALAEQGTADLGGAKALMVKAAKASAAAKVARAKRAAEAVSPATSK